MSERHIGIEDARKILGDLVDEVRYTGAEVTLTRYGKPVARLCPATESVSEEAAMRTESTRQTDPAEVSNRLKTCGECGGEGCEKCFGGGVEYP
ncbi:type II toxin-antitoxin system Phd/YefM family antitoxin [Streptomyces rhizosphaericola]|uniref:type II toxin-antitoxin system Phd/YefM family antitoxin n=1 Tax=Streptomyces rhizosphaericola TaxID=2564098 RepID=UPI0039EE5AD5